MRPGLATALALCHVALLGVGTVSCGTKDDATLAVYAQNPVVKKDETGAFPKLVGSVDVVFDMGAYSSGSVRVTTVTLRLFRGETINILPRARIELTGGAKFPIDLSAGSKQTTTFSIGIDQLTDAEKAELCAGPVSVSGTVVRADSPTPLRIGTTPVSPQGCP
jgi:hypothetical protein